MTLISRARNNCCKYQIATDMAMIGNRYNDTPAQPQSERDKTVADNGGSSDELGGVRFPWS